VSTLPDVSPPLQPSFFSRFGPLIGECVSSSRAGSWFALRDIKGRCSRTGPELHFLSGVFWKVGARIRRTRLCVRDHTQAGEESHHQRLGDEGSTANSTFGL
jgi:hypothetical protein